MAGAHKTMVEWRQWLFVQVGFGTCFILIPEWLLVRVEYSFSQPRRAAHISSRCTPFQHTQFTLAWQQNLSSRRQFKSVWLCHYKWWQFKSVWPGHYKWWQLKSVWPGHHKWWQFKSVWPGHYEWWQFKSVWPGHYKLRQFMPVKVCMTWSL